MKEIRDGVYQTKRGGGAASIVGLAFLSFGLLFAFVALAQSSPNEPTWPVALFGLLFACIGAGIAFGRSGVIVDTVEGRIERWKGLLVPMWRSERPMSSYDEVKITKEKRRSNRNTYTVYCVRLVGAGEKVLVAQERKYEPVRPIAEQLARATDLTLVDMSMGRRVEREPDALDESLRDRLLREAGGQSAGAHGSPESDAAGTPPQVADVAIAVAPSAREEQHGRAGLPQTDHVSSFERSTVAPWSRAEEPDEADGGLQWPSANREDRAGNTVHADAGHAQSERDAGDEPEPGDERDADASPDALDDRPEPATVIPADFDATAAQPGLSSDSNAARNVATPSATVAEPSTELDDELVQAWGGNEKAAQVATVGAEPTVYHEGSTIVWEIPAMGLQKQHKGALFVVGAVIMVIFGILAFFNMAACCNGIFFAAFAIWAVGARFWTQMTKSQRVVASPRELVVEIGDKAHRIPVDELEELTYLAGARSNQAGVLTLVGGGILVARSDHETVKFGHPLSASDLERLKADIERAITS